MDNILNSIKMLLGIPESYKAFNDVLVLHINTVMYTLNQLGMGPEEPFVIDYDTRWDEFFGPDSSIESVKSYIYYKVKLAFDPPQNSSAAQSFERMASEIEWRLVATHAHTTDVSRYDDTITKSSNTTQ